jgi:hypothetical protein
MTSFACANPVSAIRSERENPASPPTLQELEAATRRAHRQLESQAEHDRALAKLKEARAF